VSGLSHLSSLNELPSAGIPGFQFDNKERGINRMQPVSTNSRLRTWPCPEMYFVVECTTISAPWSIGLHKYGVAAVLSMTNGTSTACAASASAPISQTDPAGFAIDSAHSKRTSGSAIAASTAGMSSTSWKSVINEYLTLGTLPKEMKWQS
jgi:hypothetical protein